MLILKYAELADHVYVIHLWQCLKRFLEHHFWLSKLLVLGSIEQELNVISPDIKLCKVLFA